MSSLQEEADVRGKRALLATRRQKMGRVERSEGRKLASLAPEDKRGARVGGIDNVNKDEWYE